MPTSVYIESPDTASNRLKPQGDGSLNVNVTNPVTSVSVSGAVSVSNFPSIQAVSGSVAVSNLPSTQPVSGTVSTMPSIPASTDIVRGSASATGTLYTVPAGRTFCGSVSLSACVAVAGTSQPSVSTSAGVIHQITINGLALVSVASANTISDVYIFGGASGTAVNFTAGAAGTSTGQIAGRLL